LVTTQPYAVWAPSDADVTGSKVVAAAAAGLSGSAVTDVAAITRSGTRNRTVVRAVGIMPPLFTEDGVAGYVENHTLWSLS
jgi:hypothetical protein